MSSSIFEVKDGKNTYTLPAIIQHGMEHGKPIWELLGMTVQQYDIEYSQSEWSKSILTKSTVEEEIRMKDYQKQLVDMSFNIVSTDTSGNADKF